MTTFEGRRQPRRHYIFMLGTRSFFFNPINFVFSMAEYFRNIPYKQDMPPPGGYGPVEFQRNLTKRGPSGIALFLLGGASMVYGFYRIVMANRLGRELKHEIMDARIAILPLLQAEHDRAVLKKMKINLEKEAEIMKDVKGWVVGEKMYSVDRWVPPNNFQLKDL